MSRIRGIADPSRTIRLGFLLFGAALASMPQGIVSGGAKALSRTHSKGEPFAASFTDVAAEAGLTMKFTSGSELRKKYIIEANGSGAAFVDYDNDGNLDIFLVNGSRLDRPAPAGNVLYHNEGNGEFRDATKPARLQRSGWGNGVCAGDVDNDGAIDLYVTYWGPNVLYRNNGDGTFSDATNRAGVAGPPQEWSTGCTFLDYDRDGHLDLFVVSYLQFSPEKTPLPGAFPYCTWKGAPVFCGPRGLPYGSATLYRNRGGGVYEDVSVKSRIREAKDFYAFTSTATDLDGDGWTDIYVACDSTPSLFFRNNRDGTFREIGTEAGVAFNEHGAEQAGMGVAIGDFDNDGRLDITKTNFSGDYPNLYRNLGKAIFSDIPVRAGLGVNPQYVLWGTAFADLDNDGWKDIFQVAGHVYPNVEAIDPAASFAQPQLMYRNMGNGRFEDVSGATDRRSSRGAAFGDFDNDGDIDAVVMNMHERPSLLRNNLKNGNHWIKAQLEGTKSNRAAIGAIVSVESGGVTQTDAILSQSSYLSVNDFRLHFGLGASARAEKFVVRWPSGGAEEFPGAGSGQLVLLKEGSGETKLIELRR